MEISIFLARVFGLYLLIVGLAMLFNRKVILIAVNNMLQQPGLLFFSAIVTLILGILLLEWHNIWIASWPVVITVLSWLVFVKGALRVLYPQIDQKWGKAYENSGFYYSMSVITVALGIFLVYQGFFIA